jgi:hypothetical protein
MRLCSLLVALLLLSFSTSFAQQARVQKFVAPLAGSAVLRDVDDKYSASVYSTAPEVESEREMEELKEIKERSHEKYPYQPGPLQKKTSAVSQPVMSIGFIADSLTGIPPDNYSAVSKNNTAISVVNQTIAIHDGNTGAYLMRKSLYNFSLSVGLTNSLTVNVHYRFDPKVIYDPIADRFICVMLNSTNEYNWIVFGFSQTNDPTGLWKFYKVYGDYTGDTTWFDYPAITITDKDFFLTGNKIKYDSSWQAGFKQTLVYQVRKQDGYNGDTGLHYQIWDNINYGGKPLRCLHPLNPGDALNSPAQYFLSNRNFDITNDSVFIVKIADTFGATGNTLTVTPVVSSINYGVPPDARQPDTGLSLATNVGRILGGYMRGNEMQFVSTSLNTVNGASAIYHGVITNATTTPTLTGRLFSIDTLDFGYPNISFAGNYSGANESILSFNYSGPNKKPGYGAVYFDGTDFSDILQVRTGDSVIQMLGQKQQRWGDYSGSQPDWTAIGRVWVEGIYGRKDRRYGNFMARLNSPKFDGTGITRSPVKTASKMYPVPAWEFVHYEFNVKEEQSFSFYIYDIQGRLVDKILDNKCHEGKNVVQFNISPLAAGTYVLKAVGVKGEQIEVQRFVRR